MKKQHLLLGLAIAIVAGLIFYLEEPRTTEQIERASLNLKGNAPELAGIAGYINVENITISELIGKKIILVDIWTYSCINCQRTLPYLTAWHERYKDAGLEIIGVHSPEFEFEKRYENVKRAVEKWGIRYPVVLDNDHETWRAFRNQYWPRKYLIDLNGNIAYDHIGEGGYEETENKIRELLATLQGREKMTGEMANVTAVKVDFSQIGTPELYLGYEFTRGNFGNPQGLPPEKIVHYVLPDKPVFNNVYLEGDWFVDKDHVRLESEKGTILLPFKAKNANIVASGNAELLVFVDGQPEGKISTSQDDLYQVASSSDYSPKLLQINASGKNFKLYTFTFG